MKRLGLLDAAWGSTKIYMALTALPSYFWTFPAAAPQQVPLLFGFKKSVKHSLQGSDHLRLASFSSAKSPLLCIFETSLNFRLQLNLSVSASTQESSRKHQTVKNVPFHPCDSMLHWVAFRIIVFPVLVYVYPIPVDFRPDLSTSSHDFFQPHLLLSQVQQPCRWVPKYATHDAWKVDLDYQQSSSYLAYTLYIIYSNSGFTLAISLA